jgi:hypothetical protein
MQCILTRADFDLFFGGESVSSEQHQSYTCPHCGRMGFTDLLLLEHVSMEHVDVSAEVVCPVCAAYPGGEPNHVVDDLSAHLMLEHRTPNNDLDVQLSGMRAVRRIPHHGRTVSNPRTRRAANLQYQSSPSSTLMVLSPGDRDREAMDPIAELLSQLSSVRSRSAAAQNISSQLQQLEMQLYTTRLSDRYDTSRLQADRLSTAATPAPSDSATRTLTTIAFPPAAEQTAAASTATSSSVASGVKETSPSERSAFLLARLEDTSKSQAEQEAAESEKADKSLFIQELLLAIVTACDKGSDVEPAVTVEQLPKVAVSTAMPAAPHTPQGGVELSRVPQEVQTLPECTVAAMAPPLPPKTTSRSATLATTTATAVSVPPVESRLHSTNASSVSARSITKRKPVAAGGRTGKESSCAGNMVKRH